MAALTLARPRQSLKQLAEASARNTLSAVIASIRRAKTPVPNAAKRYRQLGRVVMEFLVNPDRSVATLDNQLSQYADEIAALERASVPRT